VTVLPHCSAPTDSGTASAIVAANIRHYRKTGEIAANVDMQRGY
jgi:glyoxylate/hydroxypyruvate reductase A